MQIHNNDFIITRGETWTFSKAIQNRDGSPFIISSEITNPYFLFSVSSSLYFTNDRYLLNKYLDLSHLPRFKYTQPVNIADYGCVFDDETLPFLDMNDDTLNDFMGDETSGYSNIALFYEVDNGVRNYKYWEYNNNIEGDYSGKWVPYNCHLTTQFNSDITKDWVGQNYYYQIELVDAEFDSENQLVVSQFLQNISGVNKISVRENLRGGI